MSTLHVPRWKRMSNVLTYRGRVGQWSWLLHRLAGLGVVAFLLLHILDIWLIGMGRHVFERFLFLYHHPAAKVLELFLIFAVLFHALNGTRILLVDFVPGMARHQRRLFYIEVVIVLAVLIPAAWVTMRGVIR